VGALAYHLLGVKGSGVAGVGAGVVAGWMLSSLLAGVGIALAVLLLSPILSLLAPFLLSGGGGGRGGGGGGGGGWSSGGGGDFSGGGASGRW
jgi:uncharacterized protein